MSSGKIKTDIYSFTQEPLKTLEENLFPMQKFKFCLIFSEGLFD